MLAMDRPNVKREREYITNKLQHDRGGPDISHISRVSRGMVVLQTARYRETLVSRHEAEHRDGVHYLHTVRQRGQVVSYTTAEVPQQK